MILGIRPYIMYCTSIWVIIGGIFHTVSFGIDDDSFVTTLSSDPLSVLGILVWFTLEGSFFGFIIWLSMVVASIMRHGAISFPIISGMIYGGLHGFLISEKWFSWGFFANNYIIISELTTRVLSGMIAGVLTVVVVMIFVVSDIEDERLAIKIKLDNDWWK